MMDSKSGRNKKYIHEIPIKLEDQAEPINLDRMTDELCRKENVYLNPAFINKQQVSAKIADTIRSMTF